MKVLAIFICLLCLIVLCSCEKESLSVVDSTSLTKDTPSDPSIILLKKLTKTLAKGIIVRPSSLPSPTPIQVACETGNCLELFPDLLRPYHQQAELICKDIDLTICCCTTGGKNICYDVQVSASANCSSPPNKALLPKRKATFITSNS